LNTHGRLPFPIVDAHVHIWDTARLRYPWLDAEPALNRTFLMADYDRALGRLEVEAAVFVQCECEPAQYREEVGWVSGVASAEPRLRGIVSWAPLEKGAAAEEEIRALGANPLVKGIRRIIQFEEDLEFCLRPDFIAGVRLLAGYGLPFDICISHRHTANVIRMVEQCPDVRFVLDHIGKPDIRGGRLEPWRSQIRTLASFPHVQCKVSSLATEADHARWTLDDLRPYAEHIFECFGWERVFYGGDWPVSSQAATLPRCVETILALAPGAAEGQLRRLFRENARAFYRL